jgi:hypothetical protein
MLPAHAGYEYKSAKPGKINTGVGCYTGETLTVYPYMPETIQVGGTPWTGAAIHTIDTMRYKMASKYFALLTERGAVKLRRLQRWGHR